ncbi:beta-N-acetylhexosaminidase [Shouchella sp. 1P09AA]|uniref:beta-N-acetylhexosaminidase n=1 Tax=unclassified Shouchella TaxID=2893065 RepID=UPI0039A1250A
MSKPSLKEMIGQTLVVGFDGTTVPQETADFIKQHKIGNIILFARNMGSPVEIKALTKHLQRIGKESDQPTPLLIAVDQENGIVRRIDEGTTTVPGAMALAATEDPQNAYDMYKMTAMELRELGINWNLAPVLDVNNNPDNPVIGVRSFGEDPHKVMQFGERALKGLQDGGMVTAVKHFPGHGDTDVDSHLGMPVIPHSLERLHEVELVPFKKSIEQGTDVIMTAHIHFPALDARNQMPATMSYAIMTELLRRDLFFNGVATTDDMEMDAIRKTIGTEQGCVEALRAGVDLVMISHTLDVQQRTFAAIEQAVASSHLCEDRLYESYCRIQKVKQKLTSENRPPIDFGNHQRQAKAVYEKSVTLEKGNEQLPITSESSRILVIEPPASTQTGAEDPQHAKAAIGQAIHSLKPGVTVVQMPLSDHMIKDIHKQFDTIIVGVLSASIQEEQRQLVEKLTKTGLPVHVVAMRSPYDLLHLPNSICSYINTYEFSYPALEVAAAALFGKIHLTGSSPVTL